MEKTACVLSGEGARGAFSGAVLSHEKRRYDLIVGVSSGAINAAGYAVLGDRLVDMWREISSIRDVFEINPFMLWESGAMTMEPAIRRLTRLTSGQTFGCDVTWPTIECATADLDWHFVHAGMPASETDVRHIAAAGAIPGLVRDVDGRVDGGIRVLCPLKLAIDSGAEQIDVILAQAPFQPPEWPAKGRRVGKAFEHGFRAIETMLWEIMVRDIETALDYNSREGKRQVQIRIVYPETKMSSVLGFEHCREMTDLTVFRPVEIVLK